MNFEALRRRKRLIAELTDIGLNAIVGPHVRRKSALHCEGAETLGTLEWFVVCMDAVMSDQITRLFELFLTVKALPVTDFADASDNVCLSCAGRRVEQLSDLLVTHLLAARLHSIPLQDFVDQIAQTLVTRVIAVKGSFFAIDCRSASVSLQRVSSTDVTVEYSELFEDTATERTLEELRLRSVGLRRVQALDVTPHVSRLVELSAAEVALVFAFARVFGSVNV